MPAARRPRRTIRLAPDPLTTRGIAGFALAGVLAVMQGKAHLAFRQLR